VGIQPKFKIKPQGDYSMNPQDFIERIVIAVEEDNDVKLEAAIVDLAEWMLQGGEAPVVRNLGQFPCHERDGSITMLDQDWVGVRTKSRQYTITSQRNPEGRFVFNICDRYGQPIHTFNMRKPGETSATSEAPLILDQSLPVPSASQPTT
jgi:hypothetical protein